MLHIMPLCFKRAATTCLQALSTVPLPIDRPSSRKRAVIHALLVGREVVDLTLEVVAQRRLLATVAQRREFLDHRRAPTVAEHAAPALGDFLLTLLLQTASLLAHLIGNGRLLGSGLRGALGRHCRRAVGWTPWAGQRTWQRAPPRRANRGGPPPARCGYPPGRRQRCLCDAPDDESVPPPGTSTASSGTPTPVVAMASTLTGVTFL